MEVCEGVCSWRCVKCLAPPLPPPHRRLPSLSAPLWSVMKTTMVSGCHDVTKMGWFCEKFVVCMRHATIVVNVTMGMLPCLQWLQLPQRCFRACYARMYFPFNRCDAAQWGTAFWRVWTNLPRRVTYRHWEALMWLSGWRETFSMVGRMQLLLRVLYCNRNYHHLHRHHCHHHRHHHRYDC